MMDRAEQNQRLHDAGWTLRQWQEEIDGKRWHLSEWVGPAGRCDGPEFVELTMGTEHRAAYEALLKRQKLDAELRRLQPAAAARVQPESVDATPCRRSGWTRVLDLLAGYRPRA